MTTINSHIENYLDYYCCLEYPPEYAVLLKGSWGAGKTWLVKRYCDKLKEREQKYLYVSLYGMTTFAEIEDAFFQQLHPVLSSKGMAITGKILKGVLKTTLRIDWDGDKKEDMTMLSQIPDLNLPDYLTNAENCILIFDDLERCALSIENVLGYINHFVEHQGLRVILVANEDIIIKSEEGQPETEKSYKKIKEKLIGKTFRVAPDVETSLKDFLGKVSNQEARDFLSNHLEAVKEIYLASGYENLRHLKQALWDFERLFVVLSDNAKAKEALVIQLLQLLLAFSFEIKHAKILPSDISKIANEFFSAALSEDDKKTPIIEVIEKYSVLSKLETLLTEKSWIDFFDKGLVDADAIKAALLKSNYFQDEHTPAWVKLWHYTDLSDEDFATLLHQVETAFLNKEHTDIGIIMHVIGLLLRLSEIRLYDKSKAHILKEARKYIDYLKTNKQLIFNGESWDPDSYSGLGFAGNDLAEFKSLVAYIESKAEEAKIESMPAAGLELLEIMKTDVNKFYSMICLCNSPEQIYYQTAIFKYIAPKKFIETFLSMNPANRRRVVFALDKRYQFDEINKKLKEEMNWLKNVRNLMAKEQKKRDRKISGYMLKSTKKHYIDKFIKKLEATNKATTPTQDKLVAI